MFNWLSNKINAGTLVKKGCWQHKTAEIFGL